MRVPVQLPPEFLRHKEEIEREIHQVWSPHAGQLPIILDFLIYWITGVFVQCGRKFGKTELAIYLCYLFALLFPGSEIYYVADEKDHAGDICWDNGRLPYFLTQLTRNLDESDEDFIARRKKGHQLHQKWIEGVNNAEMKIKFRNGSIIKVEGAKNFSIADGLSPTLVVYDEFKDHDRRFDMRMRPNLVAKKGRILIIGTPPGDEENYYCETREEFRHKPGHAVYVRPGYDNPVVYPGGKNDPALKIEEEAYTRKGERHVFLREICAEIVPDQTKAIFPMFTVDRHVRPHSEVMHMISNPKQWEYYSGFDPGTTSVFANLLIAINLYDKRVVLLDEIYEDKAMNTQSKLIYARSKALRDAINVYEDDWTEIYDHAAAWFQVEIANEFERAVHPCTKDMKNKEAKLSVIKDTMLYDRFIVSDKCVKTIWEIKHYAKDENGKIPKKNDHCLDLLRYILNQHGYDSVPREPLNLDALGERRYATIEQDMVMDKESLALLGGDDDSDYYG